MIGRHNMILPKVTEKDWLTSIHLILNIERIYVVDNNKRIRRWYKNGEYHRVNGPAIIYDDGTKLWFFHGLVHRVDGPAITHPNGHEEWYFYGKRHREDGPAIIWPSGKTEYYKMGILQEITND